MFSNPHLPATMCMLLYVLVLHTSSVPPLALTQYSESLIGQLQFATLHNMEGFEVLGEVFKTMHCALCVKCSFPRHGPPHLLRREGFVACSGST
ncbi:hypothetical protein B0T20DRAFT_224148 [Sordaria brevicollis]|uniref:Secreted protein n=1 Tax=Sordaria brevicollis TaxID=83679 RepID=A0AAE0PD21_SORBR|nr:hypothetical protein B0T20DRAFT_224148 [Sordaria brevicollis]